jgi:hypothetical protein
VFHSESIRQEAFEKAWHCSPKWTVLRSLQQVYGAKRIRGPTIIDVPPFFESAGREELVVPKGLDTGYEGSSSTRGEGNLPIYLDFWDDNQGLVVMVWDGMFPGAQDNAKKIVSDEDDWIRGSNQRGQRSNGLQKAPLQEDPPGEKDGTERMTSERYPTPGIWRFGSLNRERATPRIV